VVEACRRIKAQGYAIALDDFAGGESAGALLTLADYVKIDVVASDGMRAPALKGRNLGRIAAIAKRVESGEAFIRAGDEGYRFFQGFFFGQPVVKEGRVIPPQQVSRLKLLKALQDPDLSTQQLEDLVKPDPALCYRILRTVNSAGFGLAKPPSSIKEALLLLGRDSVLRWASLWVLSSSTAHGQKELLALSIVRARCSEVLAASGRNSSAASEAFLMGLCSLLDVILERPMAEVLEALNLPAAMTAALLGEQNPQRELLDCVMAYASGDWTQSTMMAKKLSLDPTTLPSAYAESLRWVRELQAA
jgi:EAL and modified HD-GYP domain-containing signal transduction protein